ncbi:UNVERIFIED_CONTAM: hypothetical protein K2H54_020478 [Gekko kuhli]
MLTSQWFWCSLVICKREGDSLGTMEKLCRQLTYHLSPHSQWRRQGIVKRKPQAWPYVLLVEKVRMENKMSNSDLEELGDQGRKPEGFGSVGCC